MSPPVAGGVLPRLQETSATGRPFASPTRQRTSTVTGKVVGEANLGGSRIRNFGFYRRKSHGEPPGGQSLLAVVA